MPGQLRPTENKSEGEVISGQGHSPESLLREAEDPLATEGGGGCLEPVGLWLPVQWREQVRLEALG